MSVLDTRVHRERTDGVDIAGTIWPLYKLEALAAGLLTLFVVLVVTTSAQSAVLSAAAVTVVVWWVRRVQQHTFRSWMHSALSDGNKPTRLQDRQT
ncbi:hypothetical protein [Rhodococcus pyridinivorans]|uniref:hypothetical protein n=1 Tax=Rhodococcus pyridinivorans TaxID=103816 RepID=UPI000A89B065|nr:hypothetical protein [Rhodococcus pyridinivorans]